jgi:hypothetical protein
VSEYWVYNWLDGNQITTMDEVRRSLSSSSVLSGLKESAGLVIDGWRASPVEPKPLSLIAGAGIDLSGRLDCDATECRRAQVNRLFRRAWHYFETIVARDAIAEDLIIHGRCPDAELQARLLPHFETVLIVRDLGAEALVEFLPRVPACFDHWQRHASEAGIEDIATREEKLVDQLLSESSVDLSRKKGSILCTVNNPEFSHTQWVDFSPNEIRGKTDRAIRHEALERVARKFLVHLTADINAARRYGGSFGSTIPIFRRILANRSETISDVALEVGLPALDGLSTAQLIEVRLKYQDTFARFMKRLRAFLGESIQQGVSGPADLQAKLKSDLIDGELEELRSSLKQAEQSLKRKSAFGLSLGTLVATIGAVTGVVTAPVAFGLAATISAASLNPAVSKYVDDTTKIRSDDMYFLLQAEGHGH